VRLKEGKEKEMRKVKRRKKGSRLTVATINQNWPSASCQPCVYSMKEGAEGKEAHEKQRLESYSRKRLKHPLRRTWEEKIKLYRRSVDPSIC